MIIFYFLYFLFIFSFETFLKIILKKRGIMFGKTSDPLQEALSQKSTGSLYRLAQSRSNFFKKQKFDTEYLGLSFSQRIMGFSAFAIIGFLLFFIALYRMIFFVNGLTGFVVPYVFSNILLGTMFGFISGFKTYFSRLLSKEKKGFTLVFMGVTVLTLYSAFVIKKFTYVFFFGIAQMVSFVMFLITFLPGGISGLKSLFSMFFKS